MALDVVGYTRGKVHPSLLVIIREQGEGGAGSGRGLAALMDENASRELSATWNAPFENETLESLIQRAGNKVADALATTLTMAQMVSGKTAKVTFNSMRMWEGTTPHSFNLTLNFVAFEDPVKEVHEALKRLEEWASPSLNEIVPFLRMEQGEIEGAVGRMPPKLTLSIGRMAIFTDMVITNVSIPIGGPKTKDGYLLSASVSVTIERTRTTNSTEIAGTFGG